MSLWLSVKDNEIGMTCSSHDTYAKGIQTFSCKTSINDRDLVRDPWHIYEDSIEGNQTYDVIIWTEWKVGKCFVSWASNRFCGSSWLHLIILWIWLSVEINMPTYNMACLIKCTIRECFVVIHRKQLTSVAWIWNMCNIWKNLVMWTEILFQLSNNEVKKWRSCLVELIGNNFFILLYSDLTMKFH
jgi:hypothetical protein